MAQEQNRKIEEILRLMDLTGITREALARVVGVHTTTLKHWFEGKAKRSTSNKPWMDEAIHYLGSVASEKKLSTSGNSRQASVYTKNLDSALAGSTLADISQTIELSAHEAPPGRPWSAKSVRMRTRFGGAFPGAAGLPVLLEEKLGNIPRGCVLIFKPTDYPAENVYQLFERYDDPDQKLIGWIVGSELHTIEGKYDVADWKLTHFAFAVMFGPGDQLTETRTSSVGIGIGLKL